MSDEAPREQGSAGVPDASSNGRGVPGVVSAVPNFIRFAVSATARTAGLGATTTVRVGGIVVRATAQGQSPIATLDEIATETSEYFRKLLGLTSEVAAPVTAVVQVPDAETMFGQAVSRLPWLGTNEASVETLHHIYDELIDESNDVHHHEEAHPAYVRVLQELTPDEARILRLFAQKGPQPSVDVRTGGTFGFGSKLVKPGVTMIAAHAGCQEIDRVPSYLNNLNRLGLIWFSREMIGDVNSYALLEAQPEVMEVVEELGGKSRSRTTLRSIELTAFGKNLCALCGLLPAEELQARATLGEVAQKPPGPDQL